MSLDNLTVRQVSHVFKVYNKLSQSLLHYKALIESHSERWSNYHGGKYVVYNANKNAPGDLRQRTKESKNWTPIKKSDMCLEDVLKNYPQYKYGYQQEMND